MEELEPGSDRFLENLVRLGMIIFLVYWSFQIVAPFLDLIVWGVILAVAFGPAHLWLSQRFGDSPIRAAIVLIAAALVFVVVPSLMLGDALGTTAYEVADEVADGEIQIPPPRDSVRDWPVIGESVHRTWLQASTNLDALLRRSSERIVALGGHLLQAAGSAVIALLQFAGSLFVAGFLLARREGAVVFAQEFFARAAPRSGERLLRVSEQTVRSVAAGVLGVAIIQATLVGIGLLVAGVPFAGVWSLLCLILGILQLPMGLVVTPIVIYQFLEASTAEAVLFLAYMAPVMLLDNVLKPILLGRGVETPMVVIFVCAIGGFTVGGFIGLFTGAIILVLAYELFLVWLRGREDAAGTDSDPIPERLQAE